MSIFSAITSRLLGGTAGGADDAETAVDFSPPICAGCGLLGPVSAEPCGRCGTPGSALRWKRERPARGRPVTWTTSDASLGVEARVHPMNDGSWWGTGRRVKRFTLPRGGPWAAVDERNPEAMQAFCAWLLPGRTQLAWPDTVAARCTLLALTLAGLGAIALRLTRTHSWGDARSGAPQWFPDARIIPDSGAHLLWARKSLELLTHQCRAALPNPSEIMRFRA